MPNQLLDVRIGTMVRANLDDPAAYVRQILPLGFESIQPFFWQTLGGKDIPRLAGELHEAIGNAEEVYRGDLEITGQVRALQYLKDCRAGGAFLANPV